jgi:hypothetical protein
MDGSWYRGAWAVARRISVAFLLLLTLGAVAAPVAAEDNTGPNHITPRLGPAAGGTSVIIAGEHFTGALGVRFGDTDAARFTVNDTGTQITAITPAHNPGPAAVTVRLANGTPVGEGVFTFTGITGVTPDSGPTTGNTPFAVSGFGFSTDATVTFDTALATNVHLVAPGLLVGLTPAHAAGPVSVTVTNTDGSTLAKPNAYTYADISAPGPPTITGIDPLQGPATDPTATSTTSNDGGENHRFYVTITGTNFQWGATVTFAATPAPFVFVVSPTQIDVVPPPHAAGTVPVTVTNPDTQSAMFSTPGFTYVQGQELPLTIDDIEPSSGPTGPNEARLVKIEGTGFKQGATVTFGTVAATSVTVLNGEHIVVNAPDQDAGTVDVTVTNPDHTSVTKTGAYTYFTPVRVRSITPRSGPTAGGTAVTITGSNFQQGATVAFDDQQATNVVVNGDGTQITATTPAHHPGVATITVTNPDHSRGYLPLGFSFTGDGNPPPTATLAIREVFPAVGPSAGGAHVIIRGSGFTAATTVTFDGIAATQVTLLDSRTLTAVTPAHAAGPVTVAVSNGNNATATWDMKYLYSDDTNPRKTWDTVDDTPTGAPSGRPAPGGAGSGGTGTAGAAGVGTGSAPNPAPPSR